MLSSVEVGAGRVAPGRIFCIGKNYEEHILELDSDVKPAKLEAGKQPVVFMKPITSIVPLGDTIPIPTHGSVLHHEVEVVILLNGGGKNISLEDTLPFIAGVTLGLDLTLRDVQAEMKKTGHPWELAKSFDHSSPLGSMCAHDDSFDLFNLPFSCFVNGEQRQKGNSRDMIFSIPTIISFLSTVWKLMPGDLIYTGTPAGIGVLCEGDEVVLDSPFLGRFTWIVC